MQDQIYGSRAAMLRGTNDSGSTTTIVDSAIALPGSTSDHFDYGFVKIRSDTAGAAPQGEVRTITEGGWGASTGTVTVTAFSGATAANDTYEIWPDEHPDNIDRLINKNLRELHMPSLFPLSMDLVTSDNNDFEATITTNAITGWTLNGSATAVNETDYNQIYNGTRSAKITHPTAATDFYSRNFFVTEGRQYYTAAVAACDTLGTAILRVRDVTNSANIDDASTSQQTMQELILPWSPPSGCRQAQIRLMGTNASDVTYWDDYQTWFSGDGVYPLPSWITRRSQIKSIIAIPPGRSGPASDYEYITDEQMSQKLPWRPMWEDTRATSELRIFVHGCSNWRPYIVAYRPLDEVTADYTGSPATTANTVPLSSTEVDALVTGVMADLYYQKADSSGVTGETRLKYERRADRMRKDFFNATEHLRPRDPAPQLQRRAFGTVA